MLNYADTASIRTIFPIEPVHCSSQSQDYDTSTATYTIGPIDPSHLVTLYAHCSNGEVCPLLVPKALPLWIINHPEFRDGYEQNYFTEEGEDDKGWKGTIPHLVNLIYSKLCGKGFEDLASGKVDPDVGIWEIGYLLRDFTRMADTDQQRALTGIAHVCFLVSFLPPEPPVCWPPAELVRARWSHIDAVNAYRARVRRCREQGKSYEEAQHLVLINHDRDAVSSQMDPIASPPSLAALLAHPEFLRGLAQAQATFLNDYQPAPLTEEEMMEDVEEWLSRDGFEGDKMVCQSQGFPVHTYLYNLGLTVGTIDQGLRYA